MINNLQEEIELFAINIDMTAKIEEFYPGEKIVIIDNFYRNPEKIQNLALSIPPTYNPQIVSGVPGGRVDASYFLYPLCHLFNQLINDVFYPENKVYDCSQEMQKATFCVNVVNDTVNLPSTVPHIDGGIGFAVGIFLNNDKDCVGGTSFYTYKDEITPTIWPDEDLTTENYPDYLIDTHKDFKKIYTADMKFNRMILYNRNALHTAYIPKNSFNRDTPRLMQMLFI